LPTLLGNLRIVFYLYFFSQGHALGIGNFLLRELINKAVAFDQVGGNAIGKIELGRGKSLRDVFPATCSTVACDAYTAIRLTSSRVKW